MNCRAYAAAAVVRRPPALIDANAGIAVGSIKAAIIAVHVTAKNDTEPRSLGLMDIPLMRGTAKTQAAAAITRPTATPLLGTSRGDALCSAISRPPDRRSHHRCCGARARTPR